MRLVKPSLFEIAGSKRLDCLFIGPLNPQEVSMRIQSIRTAVEIRNPTGNRFFRPPGEMPLGKMNRIAKAHHIAQKIRTMAKALKDARHLLAA
jgi:hypothetical protein